MAALAVQRAQLHGRDGLAPAFQVGGGGDLGPAAVGTVQRLGPWVLAQAAVEGGARQAVEGGCVGDQVLAVGVARRQRRQPVAQAGQRLMWDARGGSLLR